MANEEGVDVALGGGGSRWKVGGGALVGRKKERKREVVACLVWSPNASKVRRFPRFLMFVSFFFCSFLETNLFSSPGEPLFPFLDDIDLLFFLKVNFVELEMNKWIE